MTRLVRSYVYPGTLSQFRDAMARIAIRMGGEYTASNGEVLSFALSPKWEYISHGDKGLPENPSSWIILSTHPEQRFCFAGIEAYELLADRTDVDFLDGYNPVDSSSCPDPKGDLPPGEYHQEEWGAPFDEFSEAIVALLPPEPGPEQDDGAAETGQPASSNIQLAPIAQGVNTAPAHYMFRKVGEIWHIAYRSKEEFHLKDITGLNYIAYLIRHAGTEYGVLDLVKACDWDSLEDQRNEPDWGPVDWGNADPALDPTAVKEYGDRIKEIDEEISKASTLEDDEEELKLQNEKDDILNTLAAAKGLRGVRQLSSPLEKERQRVKHAIRYAIQKIEGHDSPLATHLLTTIKTGLRCSYQPPLSTSIDWLM
ncbi:MAG: hypothetical protein H8E35_11140 [Ardenticatenia bacterium]|nr:hypothetical protein [Ardenticatenia bacterium]